MQVFLAGTSLMTLTLAPAHSHKYHEVILTAQGEGTAWIGGRPYPFAPGAIHIVPPDVSHKKESARGFRDIYFISDANALYNCTAGKDTPAVLQDDESHTLEKLMTVMVTRFQKQKRYDPVLESLHQTVLRQIREWCENSSFDSVIEEIVTRIDNSFTLPDFTVADALTSTGYNIDYIRRRFCAAVGMTPNQYLNHQRLKFARHLLWHQQQLNLTISEIAVLSGYYDVSYFSKLFKRKEGLSPSDFAAKHPPANL